MFIKYVALPISFSKWRPLPENHAKVHNTYLSLGGQPSCFDGYHHAWTCISKSSIIYRATFNDII